MSSTFLNRPSLTYSLIFIWKIFIFMTSSRIFCLFALLSMKKKWGEGGRQNKNFNLRQWWWEAFHLFEPRRRYCEKAMEMDVGKGYWSYFLFYADMLLYCWASSLVLLLLLWIWVPTDLFLWCGVFFPKKGILHGLLLPFTRQRAILKEKQQFHKFSLHFLPFRLLYRFYEH